MSSSSQQLEIRLKNTHSYFSLLPVADVLEYLQQAIKKNSSAKGEYKSLLMRIEYSLKQTVSRTVTLKASETDRIESFHLKQLSSVLIANKTGEMFCQDCNTGIQGSAIIFERYIRESTTGKRFYCKAHNHLMLDLIDLKRAGQKHQLADELMHFLNNNACEISY